MNNAHRWTSIQVYHGRRPPDVRRASTKSQTNPGLSPPIISHYSTLRRHGGQSESESLVPPYTRGSVPLSLASATVSPRSTSPPQMPHSHYGYVRGRQLVGLSHRYIPNTAAINTAAAAWCTCTQPPYYPSRAAQEAHTLLRQHLDRLLITHRIGPGSCCMPCHSTHAEPYFHKSNDSSCRVIYVGPLPAINVIQGILNPLS